MNPANNESTFSLYLLLCDSNIIYTGIAIDPISRLEEHRQGHPKGAKFTRRFSTLELVYQVDVGSRAKAQSLEHQIKKLNRIQKTNIIEQQPNLTQLLLMANPNS